MKKLFFLSAVSLLCSTASFSQGIIARQVSEKSAAGLLSGVSLQYVLSDGIQVGGFYTGQTGLAKPEAGQFSEKYFYGLFTSIPLTHFRLVNFHFQMRAGSTNHTKFTFAPSLATSLHPTSRIAVEAGISNRLYSYAAFVAFRYTIKPFKNMETNGERSMARVSRYF